MKNHSIKIAIGADHRGFAYKALLTQVRSVEDVERHPIGIIWIDCGTDSSERTDYPIYAQAVVAAIKEERVERGVLLCGTGNGMAIAANRTYGIFAGIAWNSEVTRRLRAEEDGNILVIPTDYIDSTAIVPLLSAWLNTPFRGEKYTKRRLMVDQK